MSDLLTIYGWTEEEAGWRLEAACHGRGDVFFPGAGQNASAAKAICAGCPVIAECGAYADEHKEYAGVWGGQNRNRGYVLRRQRAAVG